MLLSLPSVPRELLHVLNAWAAAGWPTSVNALRASRGLAPLPGWEAMVAAGLMCVPSHQDLPSSEMELIERGGAEAERLRARYRSAQSFCSACNHWHNHAVPCEHAHDFPAHCGVANSLQRMAGGVYVTGRGELHGELSVAAFLADAMCPKNFSWPV